LIEKNDEKTFKLLADKGIPVTLFWFLMSNFLLIEQT